MLKKSKLLCINHAFNNTITNQFTIDLTFYNNGILLNSSIILDCFNLEIMSGLCYFKVHNFLFLSHSAEFLLCSGVSASEFYMTHRS